MVSLADLVVLYLAIVVLPSVFLAASDWLFDGRGS